MVRQTCKKGIKTAANGRFGVMAAVVPQKRQYKFGSLYPAATVVEAATTPSRWDVSGNVAKAASQENRLGNQIQCKNVGEKAKKQKNIRNVLLNFKKTYLCIRN